MALAAPDLHASSSLGRVGCAKPAHPQLLSPARVPSKRIHREAIRLNASGSIPDATRAAVLVDELIHSPGVAVTQGTLGFGFSAGGLLFPYYVGVAMALRDELGLLGPDVPVAGASAGSLIAATCKSGISESDLMQATLILAHDCRENGTRFRLRSVLARTLEEVLPPNIHELCSGKVHIAVTEVWPKIKPKLISQYESRQDLIDTLLVSCHIPWYFDGSLMTGHRDRLALDGGLTNFLPVPPNCPGAVKVACFPSEKLKALGIGLSPDTFGPWPYDMRQMIGWALEPASDEFLLYLTQKGKQDARSWALSHGIGPDAASAGGGLEIMSELSGIVLP